MRCLILQKKPGARSQDEENRRNKEEGLLSYQVLSINYQVSSINYQTLRCFARYPRHSCRTLSIDRLSTINRSTIIGLWEGFYEGHYRIWLRWYDAGGELILNPEEPRELALEEAEQERLAKESAIDRAEQERLAKESAIDRAEQERLARESEQQRADRMAAILRARNIDPDEL